MTSKRRCLSGEYNGAAPSKKQKTTQLASPCYENSKPGCKGEYTGLNVTNPDLVGSAPESGSINSVNLLLPQSPVPRVPSMHSNLTSRQSRGPKQSRNDTGNPKALPELPIIHAKSLADVPFTHRGILGGRATSNVNMSYDRLEFVGDAYIELMATRLIFPRFPDLPAGRLSQKRELLVKNETLAEFSLAYGFDKRANLPKSYFHGQERHKLWTKTMGDVFEAYVAAVILSDPTDGFAVAEAWLTQLWEPKLSRSDNIMTWDSNAKVQLASRVMGKGIKIQYQDEAPPNVIKKEGKVVFQVGAYLTGWGWEDTHLGSGTGLSKNEAGSKAATHALSNPLTAQIEAVKREFDTKRLAEKNDEKG